MNVTTIEIPLRTVYYLNLLCAGLEELGLHAHTLPVLYMIQVIVGDLIKSEQLLALNYLRLAKILESMRITPCITSVSICGNISAPPEKLSPVEKFVNQAVNLCTITTDLRLKYREQVRQHEYVSVLATKL